MDERESARSCLTSCASRSNSMHTIAVAQGAVAVLTRSSGMHEHDRSLCARNGQLLRPQVQALCGGDVGLSRLLPWRPVVLPHSPPARMQYTGMRYH